MSDEIKNSTKTAEKASFQNENLQVNENGVTFAPSKEIDDKEYQQQTSSAVATDKYTISSV